MCNLQSFAYFCESSNGISGVGDNDDLIDHVVTGTGVVPNLELTSAISRFFKLCLFFFESRDYCNVQQVNLLL
jgi:hypothetical protein